MPVDFDISRELELKYPNAVREATRRRLEDGMSRGFQVSQENVPEDRGTLRQTAFPPEWDGDTLKFGYTQPYAEPMEKGTQPFHPPIQPLVEWAERVAGDPGLGYYVATQKIPEEGIDAQPYVKPGAEAVKRWFDRRGFKEYLEQEL